MLEDIAASHGATARQVAEAAPRGIKALTGKRKAKVPADPNRMRNLLPRGPEGLLQPSLHQSRHRPEQLWGLRKKVCTGRNLC